MEKKLTRSREHRVLAGVMGGLGEFFSVDPVLLRLGYLILTVFTGFVPGIVGYALAIVIVPEAPLAGSKTDDAHTV
ncbi:MAG: PspC domain-containing protein [bacterium]|nr:PspC domain-containing protein [bacterium]